MIWFLYIGVAVATLMFASIFFGFLIAAIMDWNYRRKHRVFIELQRDYDKPRRPAAK